MSSSNIDGINTKSIKPRLSLKKYLERKITI